MDAFQPPQDKVRMGDLLGWRRRPRLTKSNMPGARI